VSDVRSLVIVERIENLIHVVRGRRVMLDSDLAPLFSVPIRRLNEQVKRNRERFREDFMFQVNAEEMASLRSQSATLKTGRGRHRKYLPYAFTEHGAIMAANVLNSPRAVQASVFVVRAFVRMREALTARKDIAEKVAELERKVAKHDVAIRGIVEAIQQLAALPEPPDDEPAPPKEGIGFLPRKR
jgi:hypothetical protein